MSSDIIEWKYVQLPLVKEKSLDGYDDNTRDWLDTLSLGKRYGTDEGVITVPQDE